MSLTKEECEKALNVLKEQYEYLKTMMSANYPFTIARLIDVYKCFEQLTEKHFNNQPLKFEELEPNMWVWDNEQKKYLKIVDVIDYDEDFDEPAFFIVFEPNEYDCWVENRFYRKQVEE